MKYKIIRTHDKRWLVVDAYSHRKMSERRYFKFMAENDLRKLLKKNK